MSGGSPAAAGLTSEPSRPDSGTASRTGHHVAVRPRDATQLTSRHALSGQAEACAPEPHGPHCLEFLCTGAAQSQGVSGESSLGKRWSHISSPNPATAVRKTRFSSHGAASGGQPSPPLHSLLLPQLRACRLSHRMKTSPSLASPPSSPRRACTSPFCGLRCVPQIHVSKS